MNRNELEHIIRAAGEIAGVKKLIILGSQSILAQFPDLADSNIQFVNSDLSMKESREILIRSVEADIMIPDSKEGTELIDGMIGELSLFHDTFGYYAQGVDQTTSRLPHGWENRLIEICNENTNYVSGMCIEVHDLIISKLFAGRKKDIEFFVAAVNLGFVSKVILKERLAEIEISFEQRDKIENFIERGFLK